jgi:hypothetical protein
MPVQFPVIGIFRVAGLIIFFTPAWKIGGIESGLLGDETLHKYYRAGRPGDGPVLAAFCPTCRPFNFKSYDPQY